MLGVGGMFADGRPDIDEELGRRLDVAVGGGGLAGGASEDGWVLWDDEGEDDAASGEGEEGAVPRRGDGGGFERARRFATGPATRGDFGTAFALPLPLPLSELPLEGVSDGPGAVMGVGGPRSMSSRYASLSSSGRTSSFRSLPADSAASHSAWHSARTSSFVLPPQPPAHLHFRDSLAKRCRPASLISSPPTWPLASPVMKARMAHSAVRIPHAGCHDSS